MPHCINLHRFAALAAVLAVALYGPATAPGQDVPPVYCSYLDCDRDNPSTTGRAFYSNVFRAGEYSPNVDRLERQFRDFLRANYQVFDPYRNALCLLEDGDRVRVSVNASAVFSREIVNAWASRSVPVSEGRNSIELYAINGSGRKGNRSYADENTGQIRVEGLSVDSQGWEHRGGAGSSFSLVVTVRRLSPLPAGLVLP